MLLGAGRTGADVGALVERRVAGVPLEHVLGWVDFCGVRIDRRGWVFVPRRRTEYLVEQAVACAPRGVRPVVVDLCCGSGAVGVAIAAQLGSAELYAVDDDDTCGALRRGNLATLNGLALLGDLYLPLPPRLRGHVDLLVANAPYVPTAAIALLPPEAREYEPRGALDGGPDGLDVQRRIVAGAATGSHPGGHLLVETSAGQAARTAALFRRGGLSAQVASSERLSATVVCGALVGPAGRTA